MPRVLLTSTSFQDTPGAHHDLLRSTGWEVVTARGPLNEADTLALMGEFDGYICGDDAITARVIAKALPRLKVISKYGIGTDKIDLAAATAAGIPVLFTPGVNHTTVAEHAFLLLLALERNLLFHTDSTRSGGWKRRTGFELLGKTMGIVGLGRIGKEVAVRAKAFGIHLVGHGRHWDDAFAAAHGIRRMRTIEELLAVSDYVSLHTDLKPETHNLICAASLTKLKPGALIVNCARGEVVNSADVAAALKSGQLRGYATDVLDQEPPPADHPLTNLPNCIVTPHIASRTAESVQRQASCAVENLILAFRGEKPEGVKNPEVPFRRHF
ncbi:MAG: phosphoglycerate dehydrogenase [Opitutales bacterium]